MRSRLEYRKTLPGDPSMSLALRRSSRARRITLRVSALDGRVTLTVPPGVSDATAMRFADERRDWIDEQLGRLGPEQRVQPGCVLSVAGVAHRVGGDPADGPAIPLRLDSSAGPQVRAALQRAAGDFFGRAVVGHATRIGRDPGRIVLRDTRSRWGSCSARGQLMFSWRLILAPPEVADYVAAHEVAHLAHMDHSRAFWQAVAMLDPDYGRHRAWLRENGAALHRWRFEA